jgi:hypothetical protein
MPRRKPTAQFEQRLIVALLQLIEQRAARSIGDRPIHVTHMRRP